ncbi:MAG: DUF86 domain-containing protein, partial [Spirochaetaceae bacterium]|nr:DUF86 domain-containing protein [Spirochaetaceae bacterium]
GAHMRLPCVGPLASGSAPVYRDDVPEPNTMTAMLTDYFATRDDVVMAFLFGSQVRETQTDESDVDVAVYFRPVATGGDPGAALEIEADTEYPGERAVWRRLEEIAGAEVDLVVLNRAPIALAASVFFDDAPIIVNDRALYWRYFLTVTNEAEEFDRFAEDFAQVKARSRSLAPTDRTRLLRSLDFLDEELADIGEFQDTSKEAYVRDRSFRRNVERWVENLVNATIDIAKTILASKRGRMPRTYRETVEALGTVDAFDPKVCDELAEFTRLRNMLAHEYLDLRFSRISAFIEQAPALYESFTKSARDYA